MSHLDASHRLIFEGTDVRGDIAHLNQSYLDVLENGHYPPVVASLLGEFLAAAVLLSAMIKFEGRLIMQARSEGQIKLLMAETTHDRQIRGIAKADEDLSSSDFNDLFQNGTLVITIEPLRGERYQSIVGLRGSSLADCLEHYFLQSEQLQTWFSFATSPDHASGLLLQQLPPQRVIDPLDRLQQWQHILVLGQTVKAQELLHDVPIELAKKLYPEEQIRLLSQQHIQFNCSCTEERIARALLLIEPKELTSMWQELGTITTTCEFCGHQYSFTQQSLYTLSGR